MTVRQSQQPGFVEITMTVREAKVLHDMLFSAGPRETTDAAYEAGHQMTKVTQVLANRLFAACSRVWNG